MRKPYGHLCVASAIGAATLLAFACGNDFEGEGSADPNADGGNGFGDGSATGEGGSSGGPSSSDTCNGQPCANYTGPKDFVEPGAPANAGAIFGGATASPTGTDPAKEPAIVYPSHETMFPMNVSHIRHDWTAGGTNDLFRLVFDGPKTKVTIYTTKKDWEPTDEQWDWIAESNRGGTVKLTVTGLVSASPTTAYTSKSIDELFSVAEVPGAIYYWSTGSAGVMRALISESTPQKFYTDPTAADKGTCVACHTVSRDGKRLQVGYGGEKLKEVGIPDRNAIVPATGNPDRAVGWTTFSPDGKLLLVASGGVLTLIDADTGATVGANNGIVSLGTQKATHPDWSGLGDQVVVSLSPQVGNKDMKTGSIALIPYNNGAWGTPNVIVQSASSDDNNFFPAFSPDNKWIVYVNATGGSKDQVTSHLRIVPVAGGTPKDLVRLNQRVNNADGVTNIGNSMPRWAPSTKPGVFWLAFSSVRAYSILRPASDKSDQIWIGAVDTNLADPSYSAFWAPFQAMPEGNHRPFWAVVAGDKNCGCVDICGDGIDNDCNGVADGPGCVTCGPTEIPNNGIDDNCDCVVDNGISCDPDDPACTVK
jgi:hypothetical protein